MLHCLFPNIEPPDFCSKEAFLRTPDAKIPSAEAVSAAEDESPVPAPFQAANKTVENTVIGESTERYRNNRDTD